MTLKKLVRVGDTLKPHGGEVPTALAFIPRDSHDQ